MKLHLKITEQGELTLSPHHRVYLSKFHGKDFVGEVDMRATNELRRFMEGAVKQYFFYQHLPGVFKDFSEARETLKIIANHTKYAYTPKGTKIEIPRSMSEVYSSSQKAKDFLEKLQVYFMENGYEFPSSEHFKDWQDTAVMKGEEYPPLISLKEKYNKQVEVKAPWRSG